jgi:hypothetical protein
MEFLLIDAGGEQYRGFEQRTNAGEMLRELQKLDN